MKKKLHKFSKAAALVLALGMALSACGGDTGNSNGGASEGDSGNGGDPTQEAQVEVSGDVRNTLTVAAGADARVLDPHGAGDSTSVNAILPVIETLIRYDENGELQPLLAESWEQIDDLSYQFKIREGVKFHNGEELKASDVVYSFQRATSEKGAQVQYILNAVDGPACEVVDDYTVILRTKEVFSPFISYLPYIGCAIINEKAYEEEGAESHPIGTGPFEFVEWTKGDKITYKRFDEYWGEKPNFENLVIKAIPEANSRLIELETGAADIAFGLTVNEMGKIEDNANLNLETAQTTVFTTLNFNNEDEYFSNAKLRQAIDYAINEEAVVQAVHRGAAIYTPGPVVPHQKYHYSGEPNCRYDVEKAQELLAESGVDVSDKVFTISVNDNQSRIDLATIVQNQLKENLGMEVRINVMETASYWDHIESGEQQMYINGWGAVGFPDADNNIYGPLHSNQIPQNNSSRYNNPELDAMLDESRSLPDGPEREALIIEIQKLVRDEVPYITFDNPTNIIGVQKYVEGFNAMPTSHQYYNWVRFAGQ